MIIEDEEGERILAVFTSPERAKPFVEHYPEFSGGILTDFPGCCAALAAACRFH